MSRSRSIVAAVAIVAGAVSLSAVALAATPKPKAPALKAGTYTGTVSMSVTVGVTSPYAATMTGTWKLKVDKAGHVRGSESMQATIPFNSGTCTTSPTSWTLGYAAALGTSIIVSGSPGTVHGRFVAISLLNQWSGSPSEYNTTCGQSTTSWPIVVVVAPGETGTPIEATLQLPLAMFTSVGHPYSVKVKNVENVTFTQVCRLTGGPT